MYNSTFNQSTDSSDEADDPSQLLMNEITTALNGSFEEYQELQSKYSNLHETYAKEIKNSKKVEKCLMKCLKFYSKLCKKYEAQQKVLNHLKESVKEKMNSLEESLRTQEKMKGLIEVYRTERIQYSNMSNTNLRKDKEILLDICCRLISESVKNNNIRNLTNIILRKFKKDLDDEKLNLLKGKNFSVKNECGMVKSQDLGSLEDVKPSFLQDLKLENKMDMLYKVSDTKFDVISNVVAKSETRDEKQTGLGTGQTMENSLACNVCNEDSGRIKILEEHSLFAKEVYIDLPRRGDELLPASENDLILKNMPMLESSDLQTSTVNEKSSQMYPGWTDNGLGNRGCDTGFLNFNVNSTTTSEVKNEIRSQENCELQNLEKAGGEVKLQAISSNVEKNSNDESNNFGFSQHCLLRVQEMCNQGDQNCASDDKNSSLNFCVADKEKSGLSSSPATLPKVGSFYPSQSTFDEHEITDRISINKNTLKRPRVYTKKPKQSFVSGTPDIDNIRKNSNAIGENLSEGSLSNNYEKKIFEQTPSNVIFNDGNIIDITREVGVNDRECTGNLNESRYAKVSERSEEKSPEVLPLFCDSGSQIDILECRSDSAGLTIKDSGISSVEEDGEKCGKEKNFLLRQAELAEEELSVIFQEMSRVRLLSPIREISSASDLNSCNLPSKIKNHSFSEGNASTDHDTGLGKRSFNSTTCTYGTSSKCKKLKLNESWPAKKEESGGLVDSIISAMSMQNEVFKTKPVKEHLDPCLQKVDEKISVEPDACRLAEPFRAYSTRAKTQSTKAPTNDGTLNEVRKAAREGKGNELSIEKLVLKHIRKFVSCSISSDEDADRSVKQCVSVLTEKPEEVIARSIVTIVLENIDEDIEMFERPAPPLTKTQHRLTVLLSVLKKIEPAADRIPHLICSIISDKFFPDTFFWPDDCVETTTRFFAALCKMRNDPKTLWKFCLKAMTKMKQRCCLVVFTSLKTWPDILFDASTLHNNILAVTVVNVFLHMPKADGLRNFNQKKKLMALKHLLINFYQFKVEDTIETYAQKVFDSVLKRVEGSGKAFVLLAKCRDWGWTSKNILPKLQQGLKDWTKGKVDDSVGDDILSVIKRISFIFVMNGEKAKAKVNEIISCLSATIASGKLNHGLEQNVIEVLLEMKEYPEARTVIREWVPRLAISDHLRNQIINVSAENILREVKLNRTSEKRGLSKFKRHAKKSKGKQKKGKTGKKRKKAGVKETC